MKKQMILVLALLGLAPVANAQTWLTMGNSVSGTDFIGSSNPADVIFKSNGTERMRILSSGSVGIGTTPATGIGFHVNTGVARFSDPGSTSRTFQINPNYSTANGDIPKGTVVLTSLSTSGEGLSFASSGTGAQGVKIGAYAYGASGWRSMWETENAGPFHEPLLKLVKNAGSVLIGDDNYTPSSYKLAVNGSVLATEVDVQLRANWPDYVFEKSYKLGSLNEVSDYINKNKHLPGIPSASEMKEKGVVGLGDMQIKQMEKIEEIYLYMFELKRENDNLKQRVLELEKSQIH